MEINEYKIMYDLEMSHWWFLGKQYLIERCLERFFNGSETTRLLDIGSGTGAILQLLKKYGEAYGTDISEEAITFLKRRKLQNLIRADLNGLLPFKNDVFSGITCLDVLEHLEDDVGFLKEMVRVCKPGGTMVITVPALKWLWSPHDKALHHKRRYNKNTLLYKVRQLDCVVKKISYYNACFLIPIAVVRKFKTVRGSESEAQSDFFVPTPEWLNKLLYKWYVKELKYTIVTNIPMGVSLLLILRKAAGREQ